MAKKVTEAVGYHKNGAGKTVTYKPPPENDHKVSPITAFKDFRDILRRGK